MRARLRRQVYSFIPILYWLPRYNWKSWFHGDLIAGLTVGIMHVPQGMAYAALAGVEPVHGMYSSLFASSIYMFFGTSNHISVGCFAVASMMVGAVNSRIFPNDPNFEGGGATNISNPSADNFTLHESISTLTLLVGLIQLLLASCRLGFVSTYMSDALVAGFTTGSAAHVFMSQLNKLLGVKMENYSGPGMLVKMLRDVIKELPQISWMTVSISAAGIVFLVIGREFVNPVVRRFSPIPVPLELILVIAGTIASVILGLDKNYGVKIVKHIPRGLPAPQLPRVDIIPRLIWDAVPLAVICFAFVLSMGKVFAKKHKYRIDATQELVAMGIAETVASFWPVFPVGASLSRSAVCEQSGAKTPLNTLFSSSLLLVVIFWLGAYLEPLPMCILSCIIVVSLKGLFFQVMELKRLWPIDKFDFFTFLVACLSTIFTDVTIGLIIGVVFSLFTIVMREQWPTLYVMSEKKSSNFNSSTTESEDGETASLLSGVEAIRLEAPLHFANVGRFSDYVLEKVASVTRGGSLAVDCSAVSYADTMGLEAICSLHEDATTLHEVQLYFVGLNNTIRERLSIMSNERKVPPPSSMPSSLSSSRTNWLLERKSDKSASPTMS